MQKPIQMAVTLRQAGAIVGQSLGNDRAIRRAIWGQKKDQKTGQYSPH
jgi:hypothetical protein